MPMGADDAIIGYAGRTRDGRGARAGGNGGPFTATHTTHRYRYRRRSESRARSSRQPATQTTDRHEIQRTRAGRHAGRQDARGDATQREAHITRTRPTRDKKGELQSAPEVQLRGPLCMNQSKTRGGRAAAHQAQRAAKYPPPRKMSRRRSEPHASWHASARKDAASPPPPARGNMAGRHCAGKRRARVARVCSPRRWWCERAPTIQCPPPFHGGSKVLRPSHPSSEVGRGNR